MTKYGILPDEMLAIIEEGTLRWSKVMK